MLCNFSDEDDDDVGDDQGHPADNDETVSDDELSLPYVSRAQRTRLQQQQRTARHGARVPTAYEVERDARIAAALRAHGVTQSTAVDGVADTASTTTTKTNDNDSGTADMHSGSAVSPGCALTAASLPSSAPPAPELVPRFVTARQPATSTEAMLARGRGGGAAMAARQTNMTPVQQQRQRTYQRNMYTLRNALREVDAETKELVQLKYAPAEATQGGNGSQLPASPLARRPHAASSTMATAAAGWRGRGGAFGGRGGRGMTAGFASRTYKRPRAE